MHSVVILFIVLIGLVSRGLILPVVGGIDRHYYANDHLLRDLSPQDEMFDTECCKNDMSGFYEMIPAQTMTELSHLTSAQFLEKYGTKSPEHQNVQIISDNGEIRYHTDPAVMYPAIDEKDVRMGFIPEKLSMHLPPVDEFVPIENHEPKSPKIASNFRMSKLVDEIEPPMAENAQCVPRETVVFMPKPKNISMGIWPECTTVKQCGGCCGNSNLLCKPTKTTTVTRKGMHLAFLNGRLTIIGPTVVSLTEHTECACQCRQNASDCHANQRYDAGNCRCTCLNLDMANNCGPNRGWDSNSCQCVCPNAGGTCPMGFHFDHSHYCSCISTSTSGFRHSKVSRSQKTPPVGAAQTVLTPAVSPYHPMSPVRRIRSNKL